MWWWWSHSSSYHGKRNVLLDNIALQITLLPPPPPPPPLPWVPGQRHSLVCKNTTNILTTVNNINSRNKTNTFLIYKVIFWRRDIITQGKVSGYWWREARPGQPSVLHPVITSANITFVINFHCIFTFTLSKLHRNLNKPTGHT